MRPSAKRNDQTGARVRPNQRSPPSSFVRRRQRPVPAAPSRRSVRVVEREVGASGARQTLDGSLLFRRRRAVIGERGSGNAGCHFEGAAGGFHFRARSAKRTPTPATTRTRRRDDRQIDLDEEAVEDLRIV